MNEELQSANKQLQSTNEELRDRTLEITELNTFMDSILGSLGAAVIVLKGSGVQVGHGKRMSSGSPVTRRWTPPTKPGQRPAYR